MSPLAINRRGNIYLMFHYLAITLIVIVIVSAERSVSSYTLHTPTSKIINYDVNVHQSNNKEVYPLSELLV